MKVSPEIESLVAYVPGKDIKEVQREFNLKKVVKLASNENPLGPSPLAIEELNKELKELGRYPDPSCFRVRKALSEYWQIPPDHFLLGNGSNELIDLIIRVFCEPGDRILVPDKSFIAYSVCAQAARVAKKTFPLNKDYQVNLEALAEFIENGEDSLSKVVFLANPNNPTGSYISKASLLSFLEKFGGREDILIVLDEAYTEFVDAPDFPDGLSLTKTYSNLLVLKTFSKVYGLAGLRVGALIGDPKILNWIHRVRNPFNVNTLAQAAVVGALKDKVYLEKSRKVVKEGRQSYYSFFEAHGIKYWPSQANFILFETEFEGSQLFMKLMEKGLLIRPLRGYQMVHQVRVSIGLDDENQWAQKVLLETLETLRC